MTTRSNAEVRGKITVASVALLCSGGSCPASARARVGSCPTNNMLITTKMKLL
jgi:hypothetical protein